MRDSGPTAAKPDFTVTALSPSGVEFEVQSVSESKPPNPPYKLPAVHVSISAQLCAILKIDTAMFACAGIPYKRTFRYHRVSRLPPFTGIGLVPGLPVLAGAFYGVTSALGPQDSC